MSGWSTWRGEGPVVAVALHAGHDVRAEVARLMCASDADRLREEDPATGEFARHVPSRMVVMTSRFEVDLNRPLERAVYGDESDTWGVRVWESLPLPPDVVARSQRLHEIFYAEFGALLDDLVARHGGFVVLDLHSYCHRRGGPDAPPDDPAENPAVNLGTGSMDRPRWAAVVDSFAAVLSHALGGIDVRENVKFRGGHLSRWVHETYPTGCCIAVEFKKSYMDEWTGQIEADAVDRIASAVAATLPGLEQAFRDSITGTPHRADVNDV